MIARPHERVARSRPFLAKRGDRYGLLLLLLIFSYLLGAFTTGDAVVVVDTVLFVGSLLLALRTSAVRARTTRLIIGGSLAGSLIVVALVLSQATSRDTAVGFANIWAGLVLLIAVGVIVRRILAMPMVSLQSLYGAISAYIIIGLMFASFYAAMSHLGSHPFFANGSPANTKTFQYFSFTTLTTLGYGDFTAAQNAGRAVAVMEALAGQIFLATLVARLVASYRSARLTGNTEPADPGDGQIAPAPGPGPAPGTGTGTAASIGAASSDPGANGKDGQPTGAAERRIPRPPSRQMRPARQAPVKWHGRRRR